MKFLPFILLAAAGFFLFAFYAPRLIQKDELSKHLERWGIVIDLLEFELKDFYKEDTRSLRKERLEAGGRNTILKITKTDAASREKYINDKKFLFNSLFLPTTSPYPGVITNIVECPEKFKPKEITSEHGVVYTLLAGERLNYGICTEDLVEYYSAHGIFDCKEKGIFEVSIFSEEENYPERIIMSFDC